MTESSPINLIHRLALLIFLKAATRSDLVQPLMAIIWLCVYAFYSAIGHFLPVYEHQAGMLALIVECVGWIMFIGGAMKACKIHHSVYWALVLYIGLSAYMFAFKYFYLHENFLF